VAIALDGDAAFAALCAAMQRPELASDPRFATAGARRAHADALDAEVTAWTQTRDPGEIERRLQADGIAASTVQGSAALAADPQLVHRGHFLTVPHTDLGSTTIEGARFQLSRTPARAPDAAPTYGRDTARVLTELLGYDEARVTALVASGVLEGRAPAHQLHVVIEDRDGELLLTVAQHGTHLHRVTVEREARGPGAARQQRVAGDQRHRSGRGERHRGRGDELTRTRRVPPLRPRAVEPGVHPTLAIAGKHDPDAGPLRALGDEARTAGAGGAQ